MTFRTAKRKTEKSSDPGKFFLSPATEKCQCQGTLSVVRFEGGFRTGTGTDTSLVRKDHPRTNLIGHQTIDPLTAKCPEHRSSFVFAASKRDDRLFWRTP
jgi:hypothetical protein